MNELERYKEVYGEDVEIGEWDLKVINGIAEITSVQGHPVDVKHVKHVKHLYMIEKASYHLTNSIPPYYIGGPVPGDATLLGIAQGLDDESFLPAYKGETW